MSEPVEWLRVAQEKLAELDAIVEQARERLEDVPPRTLRKSSERRQRTISSNLRLTEAERAEVEAQAAAAGLTVPSYQRKLLGLRYP